MGTAGGMVGRFAVVEAAAGDLNRLVDATTSAAATLAAVPGVAAVKTWLGFPFHEDPERPRDIRLAAVSVLADEGEALHDAWPAATVAFDSGVARFDVEGEPVKATGHGWGVEVPTTDVRPLTDDEPVLVVITGETRPQHHDAFVQAAGPAVAQAHSDPGYLGGCALASPSMLDITSFSCWRSGKAARRYAFGSGAHRRAKDADVLRGWHDPDTLFWVVFRVLASSGTLLGTAPFTRG